MINKLNGFDLNLKWSFTDGRKYAFAFITLLFSLLIIYGNSFNGAWIFDDEPNIVLNKYVHLKTLDWGNIQNSFYGIDNKYLSRPVAYLTFGLNYYFGGLNVVGYHMVNLIIHYFSGIFLFLFIYRTLNLPLLKSEYGSSSYAIALLATFLWAVNPVLVTAVTYIVQRMASLAGLFYIMSMFFYLIGRTNEKYPKKIFFLVLSTTSALLAIGTKENAIMLPVSLYLYDLLLIQGITKENLIKNLKFYIVPALITAAVVLLFFIDISSVLRLGDYAIRPFSMWERVLTETRVFVFYISLLLYPTYSRLMLNHDFVISRSLLDPSTTFAAILAILCSLGLAVWIARKKPLLSYCIIFFFLNHIIEGSIIPLELVFEHTNYTPSMLFFVPLCIFVIHVLDYFSYRKSMQLMITLLISFVLIAQGHTVHMYNYIFKDPYILWSDNIAKAPNLSRPHNNLGNILWNWGLYEEAYMSYEKSFNLNRYDVLPMVAAPINNMGRYFFYKKDYPTAMTHFQTSLKINPKYALTWVNIARTQIRMNDLKGAEKTAREGLVHWPDNAWLHAVSSFVLLKEGAYQRSIQESWKTLAVDGESTDVTRALAEAYRRTGHIDRAVFYWGEYVSAYRDEIEGYLALIELYSKTGQLEKLNRTVARIMILKGSKSWRELMKEYTGELAAHAYEPDPELLLEIIKKSLLNGI
jgi:tetratricopeptide (TPR) repeat protein